MRQKLISCFKICFKKNDQPDDAVTQKEDVADSDTVKNIRIPPNYIGSDPADMYMTPEQLDIKIVPHEKQVVIHKKQVLSNNIGPDPADMYMTREQLGIKTVPSHPGGTTHRGN